MPLKFAAKAEAIVEESLLVGCQIANHSGFIVALCRKPLSYKSSLTSYAVFFRYTNNLAVCSGFSPAEPEKMALMTESLRGDVERLGPHGPPASME